MINILIDTCSWIDLLTENESKLLPHLEFWETNNEIRIFTHEKIINEWDEHKIKQKKRFSDSINTKLRHTKEVFKKTNLEMPSDIIRYNNDNIENQIITIDRLLNNSYKLNTNDKIKSLCSDKTITRTAPFHNKLDSMKDAYIIFSTLEYFAYKNEKITFISSNKNDFGDPLDLDTKIHSDIVSGYKSVEIDYFSSIDRAINELKKITKISLLPQIISSIDAIYEIDEVSINKEKPILYQLHEYISTRQKELSFIPTSFFINHYPFKKNVNSFVYYSLFTLTINNDDLFELIKSFSINKENKIIINDESEINNINEYKSKLEYILTSFSKNLIFNITSYNTKETINIRYTNNEKCKDNSLSYYNSFLFFDSFVELKNSKDELIEILQSAYVYYQVGDYNTSSKLFLKAYSLSKNNKLDTSAFISHYNLSHLLILIKNQYTTNSNEKVLSELNSISLNNSINTHLTIENKKILHWLKDSKFYSLARNKIQDIVSDIDNQHYSHINGGWSSNSYVWKLINEYASFQSFITNNHIIYDKFIEFENVSDLFFKGLFISHAIDDSQCSRLEYFDDWLTLQMLYYADATKLNKTYNRYKLKELKYRKTSETGYSFEELIDNFFLKNDSLKASYSKVFKDDKTEFWSYYNKIFKNILTLVSIYDSKTISINSFSKKLLNFLEDEEYIYNENIKYVRFLLERKGESMDNKIFEKFFYLALKKSKYHDLSFFNTISKVLNKTEKKIKLSKSQFINIKNIAFEICNICNERHSNSFIISFYRIVSNTSYKKEIKNHINEKLSESFNFNLFYLATMYEIIDFDNTFFVQALTESIPKKNQITHKSFFSNTNEKRFIILNNLINICFKFDIDTTKKRFKIFKEVDDYYLWLLDMNSFNYNKFQPLWIREYDTRYYYQKISSCNKVKNYLKEYLRENNQSEIEKDYINLFVRKSWDVDI